MSTTRREAIKFVVAGAISAGCPVDLALLAKPVGKPPDVESEDNRVCHQVRDGHVFSRPPASLQRDVVIVGGGVSGLTSAYLLRDRDFLLLEKEPHWGGNAYMEEYDGSGYSTAAAFLDSAEGVAFAREIGLTPLPVNDFDGSIIHGEFVPDTWGAGLDRLPYPLSVRESFKKFRSEMLAINLSQRYTELDNLSLSDLLRGHPPELTAWWDAFGPSNWAAGAAETAAALAVETVQWSAGADRKDDRATFVGGLGAITRRLADLLKPALKSRRMLAGATIVAVVPEKEEVQVTYLHAGQVVTVGAKAVIMATPKFITARILDGLPARQREAMHAIHYAPYPVVNLIFDRPVFNRGYDTWCPGNSFTDFIVADWVTRNQPGYRQKYNILTCYTPLREGQRAQLLTLAGARTVAAGVLRDFQKLFPGSAVDPIEVHIYVRGHPMYMSRPGNHTRVIPLARHSMDRVFFANTDSEGPISSTGTAIRAARRAVRELESRLAGRAATPRPAPPTRYCLRSDAG